MPKEVKKTNTETSMVVHKPKKVVVKNDLPAEVQPGTIKVTVQKVQVSGVLLAYFHPEVIGWVNPELLPQISLARIHGKCMYRLDKLNEHDFHAPPFHTDGECDLYIIRVLKDISEAKCGGAHIEVQVLVDNKPLKMDELSDGGQS